MENQIDIDKLVSDKKLFSDFVYTPLEEAIVELERRENNRDLQKYIDSSINFFPQEMLEKMKSKFALHHRPLITLNYEVIRFISIADALEFQPLFLEYRNDKFVTRNSWKYSLGRMGFHAGYGKKGGSKIEYLNIVDLVEADGKKLCEVNTIWNESLINFHHELLFNKYPFLRSCVFDGVDWYNNNGKNPKNYYYPFLTLFIRHGILFENFLLNKEELQFTKELILPALIKIKNETGLKPLIVALEPTELENDNFWTCQPHNLMSVVKGNVGAKKNLDNCIKI